MSLKDRLDSKSAGLVRRETITLPATGEEVRIRGMMFGEKERVAELSGFKQSATMIALCVEDPTSGDAVWNANDLKDHQRIAKLPIADTNAMAEAIQRLSVPPKGKGLSGETENSPMPSSDSALVVEPLESSESA